MLPKFVWEGRCRIMEKGKFKGNEENVVVCNNWGISHHILHWKVLLSCISAGVSIE